MLMAMDREQIILMLGEHLPEMRERFHVESLSLIGSVARNEAAADSDIDVLVDFDRPVGLFTFVGLQLRLTELLGTRVDLVTRDAIRPEWREAILDEAIHAA